MAFSTRNLRRRLAAFAGVVAAAMALMTAAAAVPARADEDLAKALAAIAVIGLIAKSMDDDDRRREDRHSYRYVDNRLPAYCAVDLRDRRAGVVYAEPCLRNAGVGGRLPYRCAYDMKVKRKIVTVFPERCLRDAGYRPERRY
jgi:hypothetical protein